MKFPGMPVAAVVFLLANFTIAQERKSAVQKGENAKADDTCQAVAKEKNSVGREVSFFGTIDGYDLLAYAGKVQKLYQYACKTHEGKSDGGVKVMFLQGDTDSHTEAAKAATPNLLRDRNVKKPLMRITGNVATGITAVTGPIVASGLTIYLENVTVDVPVK